MHPRVLIAGGLALLLGAPALASSHREAPGVTEMPKIDGTDFYMFRSYASGRSGYVTLIANYIPDQSPAGAPNFYALDADAFYDINIDNTGDGNADITFRFDYTEGLEDLTLPVGGVEVSVPVANLGSIGPGLGTAALNLRRRFNLRVISGNDTSFASNVASGGSLFGVPYDNIGQNSIPDYHGYAQAFIHDFTFAGCNGESRVFVGQREESFHVNLGEIFDLINLDPLGSRSAEPNALDQKSITTFALEVPIECLTRGSEPVIGGWTTAWLPQNRILSRTPTFAQPAREVGPLVQVSRVGMPLVNEVVIGLKDKNLFNAANPDGDAALATYVTNPTLPEIIEILFGAAGVQAPNNFPRTDLVAAFATGVQGLNFLSDGQPHEMLRLNTSIPAVGAGAQNSLGVLAGDNAGFPNGRRPGDDVVDIELRVAMGVLCHAFPGVFCDPADAPSGTLPFTDGTIQDATQFDSTFPYLRDPLPGGPNGPNGIGVAED